MDAKYNFASSPVTGYYGATDTQVTVVEPGRFPAVPFNAVWWDHENFPNPADDPQREIVRVTNVTGSVLTLESSAGSRVAQELTAGGLAASTKNTAGGVYYMLATASAKDFTDIAALAVDVGTAYAWITEYGAVGDGVTDDYAAFAAAVTAGITTIIVPAGTYAIGTDWTLPAGSVLWLHTGALLAPATAKTVTISGELHAANAAIAAGAGTVTISATGRTLLSYARWAGTTDDKLIINAPDNLELTDGDLDLKSGDVLLASGQTLKIDTKPWMTVVESAEEDMDAGITDRDVVIAHGLTYTPAANKIAVDCYRSSGSGVFGIRGLWILSVDATNIHVNLYCSALAAAGTKCKIVCKIFA